MSGVLRHAPGGGDPACLHCIVHHGIDRWAATFCERSAEGYPIIDMSEVIAMLAQVIGESVHFADTEAQKLQFERYARECLEASFTHQRTGETVEVTTGCPVKGH
jgi:hypothetical protein